MQDFDMHYGLRCAMERKIVSSAKNAHTPPNHFPAIPHPAVSDPVVPKPAVPDPIVPVPIVPDPVVPDHNVPDPAIHDPNVLFEVKNTYHGLFIQISFK